MKNHPGYLPMSAMTEDQLLGEIERLSPNTTVGIGFLTEELHRRHMSQSSDRLEAMTQSLVDLTRKITMLTYIGVCTSATAVVIALVALARS